MPRRSRYGCVDPNAPEAAGRCDRGGEIRKLRELRPQMRWAGDRLVETGFLVCAQHMDVPNPQDRPNPPQRDPQPILDPRPNLEAVPAAPSSGPGLLDVNFVFDGSPLA